MARRLGGGTASIPDQDSKLARLRALAEEEMRRRLPREGGAPAAKRHKSGVGDHDGTEQSIGGRFDYSSVQQLATGITGFLLTCRLQRENSARKEAGPLLSRYLEQCAGSGGSANAESSKAQQTPPTVPSLSAIKLACCGLVAFKLAAHDTATSGTSGSIVTGASLVREVAAALLADIDSSKQRRLQHVQRVIPVQTTCWLEREPLQAAGARLAAVVAAGMPPAENPGSAGATAEGGQQAAAAAETGMPGGGQPRQITYGIAVKHRLLQESAAHKAVAPVAAAEAAVQAPKRALAAAPEANQVPETGAAASATEMPEAASADASAAPSDATTSAEPLDRGAIIASVAGGFEAALRQQHGLQAAVDLRAPQVLLVVEVLPAGGALYAALCTLPQALCVLKPRLHIRSVGKVH